MRKRTIENKGKMTLFIIGGIALIVIVACMIAFASYTNTLKEFAKETTLQKNDASEILNNALDLNNTAAKTTSSTIGKTVNQIEKENKVDNKKIDKDNNSKKNTSNSKPTVEVIQDDIQDPVFLMPIEKGEVLNKYAKDSFVYSETLEEWITHLGIDIKAEKSTVVKASAAGTVTNIKNDPRYGLSVIVEHTNGYKTIYSNLLTADFVKEGEGVTQGQTLGTVGNSATFEVADKSHLHFEILKDDENVDPEIYLAK